MKWMIDVIHWKQLCLELFEIRLTRAHKCTHFETFRYLIISTYYIPMKKIKTHKQKRNMKSFTGIYTVLVQHYTFACISKKWLYDNHDKIYSVPASSIRTQYIIYVESYYKQQNSQNVR